MCLNGLSLWFLLCLFGGVHHLLQMKKNTCPDEAQLFWMKFRSAVLNNDMVEIVAATRFPVKISQTLDDDGVTYFTKKNLSKDLKNC